MVESKETKAGTGEERKREEGGGVLQAIGETIVEIGQTTKDLLVGQDPTLFPPQSDQPEEKGRNL